MNFAGRSIADRRTVLRGLGGGFAGLGLAGVVGGRGDDTIEIVTIKRGDTPLNTEEVSEDWWAHVLKARELRERLRSRLASNPLVDGVDYYVDERRRIGGMPGRQIKVRIEAGHLDDVAVPSEVDGVPVEKRPEIEFVTESCEEDRDRTEHDWVPGGSQLSAEGSTGSWSATCKVHLEGEDDPWLMTCAHAFDDWDCDGKDDTDWVEHVNSRVGLGWRANSDFHMDFACVNLSDTKEIEGVTNSVKYQTSTGRRPISGRVTRSGFDYYLGDTVHNYGARTSHTSGELFGILDEGDVSHAHAGWCEPDGEDPVDWFHTGTCTLPGDSGSPHYVTWVDFQGREQASILGVHIGSPDSNRSEAFGSAAYEIYDEHDITFGD